MPITVNQLREDVANRIDKAFEKTVDEMNWPHFPDETVNFYDLMKIFKNLRINLKKCLLT